MLSFSNGRRCLSTKTKMSYFGRWSLAKAAANNSLPVVLDLMGISIFMKPEPAASGSQNNSSSTSIYYKFN
ncbi:Molybdenum import ATP-binding protein ModC [Trichinella spiralis]|uniref:Molybdenum import ATP-binding protein ModC n=1 Tax=Trichinella spiralis TaxID=6334 RepID=A0ABR3KQU8_TRISP